MNISDKLLQELENDFNNCSVDLKISNTWENTGFNNLNYFRNKKINSLAIDSNIKGLFHIDQYPSTSFLNKSNISYLHKLQSLDKLEFYKKIDLYKKNISPSYVINYRNFLNIKKLIKKNDNILEIGGGLGILSSMIYRTFDTKIFLCDIPSTLILQKYYLKKNFPKNKIQFIANFGDKIDYDNDFFLINSSQLSRIDLVFDLIINIDSFSEMNKESISEYLNYGEKKLKKNGHFYLSNTIGHSTKGYNFPTDINLPKKFIIKDIDVLYPTARDNYCKYFNLILKKKNTLINIRPSKKKILSFYLYSDNFLNNRSYDLFKKKILNNYKLDKINKQYQTQDYLVATEESKKNSERLFLFFLKRTIKELKKKHNKKLQLSLYEELKKNELSSDISIISKLILLYSIILKKIPKKFLDLIKENSFESIFLKFNLTQSIKLKNIYLIKLIKFNNLHYFDILKIYYCAHKVKNLSIKKRFKKIILNKAKNKLLILYFLKLLIMLGDVREFISLCNHYIKISFLCPFDISHEIISINCVKKRDTIKIYEFINSKICKKKFFSNSILNYKIFEFKSNFLKEKDFLKFVRINYWNNYYQLGYILKNNLNFLKKKNVNLIASRSLKLNNSVINKFFIADIYFFNFMKEHAVTVYSKIYQIESINIYQHLKKNIAKKFNNLEIRNLIYRNFFNIFNSGNLIFMPIFNSANNQINFINKK